MIKLGVITDGISRDFEHALDVMDEYGLKYAELQYVWDKEVGDLSTSEIERVRNLTRSHGVSVSCVSRGIFGGLLLGDMEKENPVFLKQIDALKRCIDTARALDCPLVRVMSFRKEMILFGDHGADVWNVSVGAWDKFVKLMAIPVRIAEQEGVTLVVETGNNAMITSAYLGRKLIDELETASLKVLWDPCNSLYCNEPAFPDGYEELRDGYLGHIHMKDSLIDIPRANVDCTTLGSGDMAPYLEPIAAALEADNYNRVISLESVYRPNGGTFEEGFRASVRRMLEIFG